MKIGIVLGTLLSEEDVIRCARLADRYLDPILIPESWSRDAFVTLGVISNITEHSCIGTSIVNIYSRTASSIAMAAATLDLYSRGRVILGLGASSKTIVENWHGLEFRDQVIRMKEYVESIRLILKGEKLSFNGKIVRINNFKIGFKPLRIIPIYIAALKPKMLRLALEIGDGIIIFLYPFNVVEEISRLTKKEIFNVIITCVHKDEDKAMERVSKTLAFYIAVGDIYAEILSEKGYKEEVTSIREEYKRNGLRDVNRYVSKRMLEDLTIYGNKERFRKRLEWFKSKTNIRPIIHLNPLNDPLESLRDIIEVVKE